MVTTLTEMRNPRSGFFSVCCLPVLSAPFLIQLHGLLIQWCQTDIVSTLVSLTSVCPHSGRGHCGSHRGSTPCMLGSAYFLVQICPSSSYSVCSNLCQIRTSPSLSAVNLPPNPLSPGRLYQQELPLTHLRIVCVLGPPSLLRKETLFSPKVKLSCVSGSHLVFFF